MKNKSLIKPLIGFLAIMCTGIVSHSAPLSNVALFNRCYNHITQRKPSFSDPLTMAVRSGTRTPISACLEILDRARFSQVGQTQINRDDPISVLVLQNLHKLHASWFSNKDIVDVTLENPTRDIFDVSEPALYFTRALFGNSVPFDSVVTSTETLRAVRTDDNPARGPSSNQEKTNFIFRDNPEFKFAGKGNLLGFEISGLRTMNYSYPRGGGTVSGSVNLGQHYGGGLMGHPVYFAANVQQEANFQSNGTILIPRKFARSILADLMCREIPVVREEDVSAFVVPTSTVPFRNAASCVTCHATIDRMAYVIRGFSYDAPGFNELMNLGVNVPRMAAVDQPAETSWVSEPDPQFHRRPTNGVLFYRNLHGTLVNLNITSLQDLGVKLAQQEDVHICIAKRYYRYFTGIDAFVGDATDPNSGVNLSATDRAHREQVISLGRNLKSHQSLRLLIQDILNLPIYRESNYGVTSQGGT